MEKFEKEFFPFCGWPEAIDVGSGTEALWMAIGLGVGPGDEVITVPNTFTATAEPISFCGATPVFVDVDERTCTLDSNKLEDLLKDRSKQEAVGRVRRTRCPLKRGKMEGSWNREVASRLFQYSTIPLFPNPARLA